MPLALADDLTGAALGHGPDTLRVHTRRPDHARERTMAVLGCRHTMSVDGPVEDFAAAVSWRRLDDVAVLRSRYGTPVTITCTPPIPWVTLSLVPRGAVAFRHDDRVSARTDPGATADAARGVVLDYDREVGMRWQPDTEQFMVAVRRERLERDLRGLVEDVPDEPLRFEPELGLSDHGRAVLGAVVQLRDLLDRCADGRPPAVLAAEVERAVVTALLLGTRHNHREHVYRPRPPAPRRALRRVLELIESDHSRDLAVADLAACAGTSERSLHAAFRAELGTTPIAYLRERRLEHAHEELLVLDPGHGDGVAAVAYRHGFTHLGRFAAAYRTRFGEAPSQTLRR